MNTPYFSDDFGYLKLEAESKGSDSISNNDRLTSNIRERLSSYGESWSGTDGELSAAIETLRKRGALPSIRAIM